MILTVLGSGGISPDPQRGGAAYLLSDKECHLLLDAGPGSSRALVKAGYSPADLFGICITHRHPDHTSEFRLIIDQERSRRRSEPLLLAGPEILDDLINFHLTWGRDKPASLSFQIDRLVLPGKRQAGSFLIESVAVPHVSQSVGLRITAGNQTIVYPGDCGPSEKVVLLAKAADLLILECTLASGQNSRHHLSPEDAGQIALQSGCKKLVLSHFPPTADVENALAICNKMGVVTEAAYDGAIYRV
ncbi:MAG: MBL fold metallo-hydrolase [Deltaproteobacteria bacterium]|nr:MBL fold metallo-hydrolase [Deltaproteobacteria bacterium]MBW1870949.1 MBL fold metallo-hydrolase [Deltaproteobacteria bacterium]